MKRSKVVSALIFVSLTFSIPGLIQGETSTANRFKLLDNSMILDEQLNITWQRCSIGQKNDQGCTGNASSITWKEAKAFCNQLDHDKRKWRLPTQDELKNLVYCSNNTPVPLFDLDSGKKPVSCGSKGEKPFQSPTILNEFFPNTAKDGYWSSRVLSIGAWYVSFIDGFSFDEHIEGEMAARCVSDN